MVHLVTWLSEHEDDSGGCVDDRTFFDLILVHRDTINYVSGETG